MVNNKGETNRFNLDVTVLLHRGRRRLLDRILGKRWNVYTSTGSDSKAQIEIELKRNSAVLPLRVNTTSPPFLVRKITIGDIHFYISISFSISS